MLEIDQRADVNTNKAKFICRSCRTEITLTSRRRDGKFYLGENTVDKEARKHCQGRFDRALRDVCPVFGIPVVYEEKADSIRHL